jgi:hypothetical protein
MNAESGSERGDGFTQAELLHLQFIQDVIERLSNYGSLIKGWSITFAGVMFGVAAGASNAGIALVVVPATLLFWSLDAYFLWTERCFRRLFDDVRSRQRADPFFMAATAPHYLDEVRASIEAPVSFDLRWRSAMKRPTLSVFYVGTCLAAAAIAAAIWWPSMPGQFGPVSVPVPSGELLSPTAGVPSHSEPPGSPSPSKG